MVGTALSAAALILLAASMSAVAPGDVDRASVDAVVTGTSIGAAWQARLAALLGAIWLSVMGWRKPKVGLAFASITGAAGLGSLA